MGFSRQEYWSGLPFLLQGIFPIQGSSLHLLHLLIWQADSLPSEPPEEACNPKQWPLIYLFLGFPSGSVVKNPPVDAGDAGDPALIPGSGRCPGEGNGNPIQYSCLENPMDGGASQATVHGVAKSRTRLSDFTFTFFHRAHYFCPLSLGRSRVNLVLHILLVKAVMSSIQIKEEDVINFIV